MAPRKFYLLHVWQYAVRIGGGGGCPPEIFKAKTNIRLSIRFSEIVVSVDQNIVQLKENNQRIIHGHSPLLCWKTQCSYTAKTLSKYHTYVFSPVTFFLTSFPQEYLGKVWYQICSYFNLTTSKPHIVWEGGHPPPRHFPLLRALRALAYVLTTTLANSVPPTDREMSVLLESLTYRHLLHSYHVGHQPETNKIYKYRLSQKNYNRTFSINNFRNML